MLALLHRYADAIERDLARIYGIRYSDRWRFDQDGTRRLTLREIWIRIQELPHDSSLVRATNQGRARWSTTDYLLADLWQAWTGKPHYARPKTEAQKQITAKRRAAEQKVNRRFAARRRAIEASTKNGGDA
ncbi:Uncharacterised protein [Nocardia otitidiscaviarum]|uniref:Uncharacterized protein n=1 Tax=Nocardia otitidiscaviarum TaxID=1823 RepID=A0A378Y617_9NOCA|nr:hypothetical protein [Nocardia otitidiscaviarum]SUA72655.1 Uncharacterised protein [Nocardia otitidiscaviarum]